MNLYFRNARILTLANGEGPRRGSALGDLGVIECGELLVSGDRIAAVGQRVDAPEDAMEIDAAGRVLMPGFVDCHTHACWAGDRLDEWELKLAGVPYLDILKRGGGIHSSVRAVRDASEDELTANLTNRLARMLCEGSTTVEVKSGYGLTAAAELKMLRAICRAAEDHTGTVVATAMLGHAVEGDPAAYCNTVVDEILPAVSSEFPGIAIDAFCEEGAWSLDACTQLFEAARQHGHPLRVHADQFNALGMTEAAVRLGALSVDHLEASTHAGLAALADSSTFGVVLPASGFHTDRRYARAGEFVAMGGAVALATNCNPGTGPTHSMPMAIALAVRFCGLTPAQAIAAATVNPATLLGLRDRGTLAPGQRADLILLRHRDERELAHELGGNPVDLVVCGGKPF